MVPISGNQGGLINPRVFFQIVRQGGVYYSIRMGGVGLINPKLQLVL